MFKRLQYVIARILCKPGVCKSCHKPIICVVVLFFLFGFLNLRFTVILFQQSIEETSIKKIPEIIQNYTENINLIQTTDAIWLGVKGTKYYVYSAYYERRNVTSIRIIAIAQQKVKRENIFCRFWYEGVNNEFLISVESVVGYTKIIEENWDLPYSAAFIICPINKSNIPNFVSIVGETETVPSNRLLVRNRNIDVDQIPFDIAICVPPSTMFSNDISLVEFFELNSIFGVTHFTVFNGTFPENIDCVLREYQNDGSNRTIEIIPWNLPVNGVEEIGYNGMLAALNDCLYRNMYSHSHLLPLDVDEFLFPGLLLNLTKMVSEFTIKRPYAAGFLFQNAFFYKEHPSMYFAYNENYPISRHLITLTKTRKKIRLNRHRERSKYICRPERVVELWNHIIRETNIGSVINVSPQTALLHHYSNCEFNNKMCPNYPWEFDNSALKFKTPLIARTAEKYNFLNAFCNLTKI